MDFLRGPIWHKKNSRKARKKRKVQDMPKFTFYLKVLKNRSIILFILSF